MKLRKQKSSKKPLLIGGAALLVVIGAGAWWYASRNQVSSATPAPTSAPTNTVNYSPATEQEKADSTAAKQDAINAADQPTTSGSISVVISRASKVGSTISVRTIVNGAQEGSCDMTFTKNGQPTVSKNFAIAQGPTAATCNGDIPVGDFSASGSWTLSVIAKNGTTSSAPATQPVEVSQ